MIGDFIVQMQLFIYIVLMLTQNLILTNLQTRLNTLSIISLSLHFAFTYFFSSFANRVIKHADQADQNPNKLSFGLVQ